MQSVPAIMAHSANRLRAQAMAQRGDSAISPEAPTKSQKIKSPTKRAALEELSMAHRQLGFHPDGRVDTKGDGRSRAVADFLLTAEQVMPKLEVLPDAREYRQEFTVNYQRLFQEDSRLYRLDVLEGCMPGPGSMEIWVNGELFLLSRETCEQGDLAYRAFAWLLRLARGADNPDAGPSLDTIQAAMRDFDRQWLCFEQAYIKELIEIEVLARDPLVQAVNLHEALRAAEERSRSPEQERKLMRALNNLQDQRRDHARDCAERLVEQVCRLNALANTRGRGRDDLGLDIWERAEALLREKDDAGTGRAGRLIAQSVVDSMAALREYLDEAGRRPERIDPQLRQNTGLADRLADWEESWETARRYASHDSSLRTISAFVRRLGAARERLPSLAFMCEEQDAELFVVLPRLFLLCYLLEPKMYMKTLARLLPHRFLNGKDAPGRTPPASPCSDSSSPGTWRAGRPEAEAPGEELHQLQSLFGRALRALGGPPSGLAADAHGDVSGRGAAWEALVRGAVRGEPGRRHLEAADAERLKTAERQEQAMVALSALMLQLETWSMELQRHSPEDWNQYASVVLQCLEDKPLVSRHAGLGTEFEYRDSQ